MADSETIRQQIDYYRARAGEYDQWFYRLNRYDHGADANRRWFDEAAKVMSALHALPPVEYALELACGTGIWTHELLKVARHVTAIDAAPEVIDISRAKLGDEATRVDFQQHDLFAWQPERQYDMALFGFWLSHVPPERLDPFLTAVNQALKPGGTLFGVDSLRANTSHAKDNPYHEDEGIIETRRLNDGREFQIVKIFYEPNALQERLNAAGFDAQVHTTDTHFWYAIGKKVR